jgi:hypothetical protein
MSTAPVERISSVMRWLPAMAMPLRMSSSLPVQHTPTRLMPSAPLAFAAARSSSDWQAADTISDTTGLWP